ncbi:hypothetical protein G6F23_015673 [Rhizopus arrhizus]|nr:hypothetical protein G6F23_015673 [Rhizopus arrhizus]
MPGQWSPADDRDDRNAAHALGTAQSADPGAAAADVVRRTTVARQSLGVPRRLRVAGRVPDTDVVCGCGSAICRPTSWASGFATGASGSCPPPP